MTDEARKEFDKFKATQGVMLLKLFEYYTPDIEEKIGKEVATGFALGIDMVHLAITGLTLDEALKTLDSNADSVE